MSEYAAFPALDKPFIRLASIALHPPQRITQSLLKALAKSPFLPPALLPNAHLLLINSALASSWEHCDSFFIRPHHYADLHLMQNSF